MLKRRKQKAESVLQKAVLMFDDYLFSVDHEIWKTRWLQSMWG